MVRKNFTPEQIINKLREAEILLSQYRRKIVRLANSQYQLLGYWLAVLSACLAGVESR